jgi:hypothetical protein
VRTGKYSFSRQWYEFDTFDIHNGMRRRTPSLWSTPTQEVVDWCIQHFGPAPEKPDAWSRWFWSEFVFNFRDEADYMFFKLRWA